MKEYMLSLFITAAAVSFFSFILYKEEERTAKFALGVVLLYVAAVPLFELAPTLSFDGIMGDVSEYIPEGGEYGEVAREAFESGVRQAVCTEFSLDDSGVRVCTVAFDFESMSAEKIRVILSGSDIFANIEAIEKYVTELGYGKCEVEIEI